MAPRIKIRSVDPSTDVEAITKIYNYYVTDSFAVFETNPLNENQMGERVERISSKFPFMVATINCDDAIQASEEIVIGCAYADTFRSRSAYDWTVETNNSMDSNYIGKGVGRPLYQELVKRLKTQGFVVAVAKITMPSNERSLKFHEKFGFKLMGKL